MAFEVLLPIPDVALAHVQLQHHQSLGNNMRLHSDQDGFPDLDGVDVVIICLRENRRAWELV